MIRVVILAAIVSVIAACKPTATDSLGHGGSTSVSPDRAAARPRTLRSPLAVLGAHHHAEVTAKGTQAVPGGAAFVYTYGRLEAQIGALTAEGHDVAAELEEERQRCEDDRAALDPGERDYVEMEYQSCEAMAGATRFGDDQLTPECQSVGVAHFAANGRLLDTVELDSACLESLDSFEAYDLTTAEDDELIVMATFATYGGLSRGGWGRLQQTTHLYVLASVPGEGERRLVAALDVELDTDYDGGNCNNGIHRSARVAAPGVLEVFSQPWDDCAEEACADMSADADEDAEASDMPVCQPEPVTAVRAVYRPESGEWDAPEPFEFDGTELPDGIRP